MTDPRTFHEPRFIISKPVYLQACAKWGKEEVDEALKNNGFIVTDDERDRLIDSINERWRPPS